MSYGKLSYLYHPTTIYIVDDNISLLESSIFMLNKNLIIKTFSDPEQALEAIKSSPQLEDVLVSDITDTDAVDCTYDQRILSVDTSSLHKEIYNPFRFTRSSVVVVDYSMPKIDGRDFCLELQDHPIIKIMLTGEADHQEGITLFNAGIIDRFIKKDPQIMYDQLNQAIQESQLKFFQNYSQKLTILKNGTKNLFNDIYFIDFFYNTFNILKACEFYLLNNTASFLFFDDNANPIWLIIQSAEAMQQYYDIAYWNNAPHAVLDGLQQKKRIPFFLSEEDQTKSVEEWENYLYPAHRLPVKEGEYYYSLVTERIQTIDYKKVLSTSRL